MCGWKTKGLDHSVEPLCFPQLLLWCACRTGLERRIAGRLTWVLTRAAILIRATIGATVMSTPSTVRARATHARAEGIAAILTQNFVCLILGNDAGCHCLGDRSLVGGFHWLLDIVGQCLSRRHQ